MSTKKKENQNDFYEHFINTSNGKILTDDAFKLPEEVDFYAKSWNTSQFNKLAQSELTDSFFLEAPPYLAPGYYDKDRVFIVKADPFIPGLTEKQEKAKQAKETNKYDGDTLYYDIESLQDSNTSFYLGEVYYDSFKDFVTTNTQPGGEFGLRFLGINAGEIPHYSIIPARADDLGHERRFKIKDIKNKNNFTYLNSHLESDEVLFYYSPEDNLYNEILPEGYVPYEPSSNRDKDGNLLKFYKVVFTDSSESETLQDSLKARDTLEDILKKASDSLLMIDHKSLTRKSDRYESPYDIDFLHEDYNMAEGLIAMTKRLWLSFFGEERYYAFGFTPPGTDNSRRCLGALYVKIHPRFLKMDTTDISEEEDKATGEVWINVNKYLLYLYRDAIEPLPDYKSNPLYTYHEGFASNAFKLWSYDIDNKENLDHFYAYTNEFVKERNEFFELLTGIPVEDMLEYYMILGDSVLTLPPTSIRCITQIENNKVPLLRSRGSTIKTTPRSERIIEMNLYFNEEYGINGTPVEMTLPNKQKAVYYMNGLRSLVAQFKLTPFLPIENRYINKVLNIDAVTLVGLSVNTIPGYPKCIQATLTLQEFNYRTYMPELPIPSYDDEDGWKQNAFSRTIHYPVMRWYYQRLLQKGEGLENLPVNHPEYIKKTFGESSPLVPMVFETPRIRFYMPSRSYMDQRLNLALETQNRPVRTQIQMTNDMENYIQAITPLYDKVDLAFQSDALSRALSDFNKEYVVDFGDKSKKLSQPPTEQAQNYNQAKLYTFVSNKIAERKLTKNDKGIFKQYDLEDDRFFKDAINYETLLNQPSAQDCLDNISNTLSSMTNLYGRVTKEVSLSNLDDENGVYQHTFFIPLPSILETNEKLEFFKHIISELGITTIDDVITRDSYGKECVKIVCKAPYHRILNTQYLADQFELDTQQAGYRFLAYCKDFYKIVASGPAQGETEFDDDSHVMQDYVEDLYDHNRMESPDSIPFEEIDLGDEVIVESLSCHYSNSLARINLSMDDGYAHQYCGGHDVMTEVQITTKSESAATILNLLPRMSASYVRDYRLIMNFWPLRIDSEITKFFGVNEVVVESTDVQTIPNFPGVYRILLRLTSVDRTTRNREALKKLEGINNSGSVSDEAQNNLDTKNFFDLERTLGAAEIYPDLELPTIDELNYVGYTMERYTKVEEQDYRTYVDPDFYFVYGYTLGHEIIRDAVLRGIKELQLDNTVQDVYGASYILSYEKDKPYAITSKNRSAELIEQEMLNVTELMPYEKYKALRNQNLDTRRKIKDNFATSIAGLRTTFWDISKEARFAFREPEYAFVEKDTDKAYLDQIKKYEDKLMEKINGILSKPIAYEAKIGAPPSDNQYNFQDAYSDSIIKHLTGKGKDNNIYAMADLFDEKFFEGPIPLETTHIIKAIIDAAADAMVGKAYMFQTLTDLADTDIEKESEDDWKATAYAYHDKSAAKIVPHCKVRVPNDPERVHAISFEDGMRYGYAFGVFQVPMLPKETILSIIDKDDYEQIKLIKNYKGTRGLFLDPYYRNLQLTDPTNEELKRYKYFMMSSATYCAEAFMRTMHVWYQTLLKNKIALSVYETTREDALKGWKLSKGESEIKDLEDLAESDFMTQWSLDTYVALLYEYYDGFDYKGGDKLSDMFTPGRKDDQWLEENAIPKPLREYIKSIGQFKKLPFIVEDLKAIKEKYDGKEETEDAVSSEQIEVVDYLLSIIERAKTDQDVIITFGNTLAIQTSQMLADLSINYASADSIREQLKADEHRLMAGRIFTCAMLAIGNGEIIYPMLHNRDVQALDNLLLTLPLPDREVEYSVLKKFILALDGRGGIKTNALSGKNETAEDLMSKAIAERVFISYAEDPKKYLRDSFLDMIKHDKRGRMLRAFPCYYMLFIDEGRKIGLWRIHDNFYNMNAIAELNITKSRKIAADTARIVMTNMFKTYTTEEETVDLEGKELSNVRYNIKDAFNSIFSPRTYYMQEELRRMQELAPTKARLKPGIRIHLRLGYGSDASELPIVFNGVVAEVGAGELVEIVAQGDGVELMNPLMDVDDASDVENEEQFVLFRMFNNFIQNGATPKQILTSILTTEGKWIQKMIRKLSNGRFFNNNPYGIVHFGDPKYTQTFSNGEVAQNIYEATSRASWGADNTLSGLEPNYDTGEAPKISIHMYGKTYWDLMHICALTQHDFMASIVPFGLRSSIFYGAGRYYYAYDYYQDDKGKVFEKRKPFQQYHIYSSFSDIIHNNIKASAKDVKTCAVGIYQQTGMFGSESTKQVGPLWVDHDIYPEFQKTMNVDTQFWAKGLPIIGNLLGVTASLSKDVDGIIPGAKEIAWRMTATSLKNAIKEMYQGELTVIGDPTVKPYDRMFISDVYEQMDGSCEIEAVVHTFNASTGFTTSLYADCIAAVDDKYEQFSTSITHNVVGTAFTALAASSLTNRIFGTSGKPLLNAIGSQASKATMKSGVMINNLANFLSDSDLKIADKFIEGSDFIKSHLVAGDGGVLSSRAYYAIQAFSSANKRLLNLSDEAIKTFAGLSSQMDDITKAVIDLDTEGCIKDIDKHIKELSQKGDKYGEQIQALKEIRNEIVSIANDTNNILKNKFSNKKEIQAILDLVTKQDLNAYQKEAIEILKEFASSKDVDVKNMKQFKNALQVVASTLDRADDIIDKAPGIVSAASDVKDLAKVAKAAVDLNKNGKLKKAFKVVIGAAGGWVSIAYMIVETLVWEVLAGFAHEWLERTLQNLEVLQIYPMRRKSRVMVAGINGHKGSVVGSPTHNMQGEWTEFLSSIFDGEGDGLANMVISMLTTERTKDIAKNLRRERNIPETELPEEEMFEKLQERIAEVYTKKTYNNSNSLIYNKRVKTLNDENSGRIMREYLILPYNDRSPISRDLQEQTFAIQKHPAIEPFIDREFLNLYTEELKNKTTVDFETEVVSIGYKVLGNGVFNVPVLRPDALKLLTDALEMLWDDFEMESYHYKTENKEHMPQVFLTSATIVGDVSWEGTGLAFRLNVPDSNFDMADFAKRLKAFYDQQGAPDFMVYKRLNSQEYVFMVKPLDPLY